MPDYLDWDPQAWNDGKPTYQPPMPPLVVKDVTDSFVYGKTCRDLGSLDAPSVVAIPWKD